MFLDYLSGLGKRKDTFGKIERNIISETVRYGSFDTKRNAKKDKHMKAFEDVYDKLNLPLEALIGPLVVEGMIHILEHPEIMKNHKISIFDTSSSDNNVITEECINALVTTPLSLLEKRLLRTAKKYLTWEHRSAAIWTHLCPSIYGSGNALSSQQCAANVIGID
eukprot:6494761-Ditylum_brightwellii.AAC.1